MTTGNGSGPHRFLVVGSDADTRALLKHALADLDIAASEAESAGEALALLRSGPSDLILAEYSLSGSTGLHLLTAAREIEPAVSFILIVDEGAQAVALEGLRQGADAYFAKPLELEFVRHAVDNILRQQRLEREVERLRTALAESRVAEARSHERTLLAALLTIAGAVELREGYNGKHVERVTRHALATARRMRLDAGTVRALWIGALLHDVGKLGVPERILKKQDRLTSEEDELLRQHPLMAAALLKSSDFLAAAARTILHHHENWDGSGYPYGLARHEIPVASRILGVAEAFDALVTTRPYRPKRTRAEAFGELRRCAGAQFDAEVVDAFIRGFDDAPSDEIPLFDGLDPAPSTVPAGQ
jgi:response regulator RpfG family c-di-GMP phosphodiesterase